ncbi:MAG: hypothetical protein AAF721_00520 [Myxococcota bacterium]
MRRFGRLLAFSAVFAGVGAVSGCGALAEEIVEQRHIAEKARAYEFSDDVDETWAEARIALEEGGFKLVGKARVDETVVCPGPESRRKKSKAHLRITKTGWFSHKLEIDILEEEMRDGSWQAEPARQASSIEWKVVKRRDPDYAKKVEAEAEKKGEKGRKIVKDIDDLLSD